MFSKNRICIACLGLIVTVLAFNEIKVKAQTTSPENAPTAPSQPVELKFSFGPRPIPGYTQVQADAAYSAERGYGFDLGSKVAVVDRGGDDPLKAGHAIGQNGKPFFFSAKLSPGAYRVTVVLGDAGGESTTTVKSETRRLMLEAIHSAAGQFQTRTFLIHLRVPQIPGGGEVKLKPRERDPILYVQWDENTQIPFTELDWDEKLTLELSGDKAALCSLEITNAENPITVYLIGDSTVTDQMMEPWGAWGQMLPRWFKPPVLVANYAESGETTASFIGERRWQKLLSEIHSGDYVLMQFGINDRRLPVDQFKQYFERFINETKQHGATPVLVTSQNLRRLDENGKAVQTLAGYPDAMRQAAKEKNAALIDLNAMSMSFYEALGPENLPKAFVDGTHQNNYGSYELAKCVVNGIVENKLPFAQYIADDWKPFDPAHPDAIAEFKLPADPQLDPARPGGPGATNGQGPMAGSAVRRGAATSGTAQTVSTPADQPPANEAAPAKEPASAEEPAQTKEPSPATPVIPTIFIAGDSTAQPGNPNAIGWGKPFADLFDPAKVKIVNCARGGRSSRTFISDGSWENIISQVKAHDYVLIQFGHNDGGPINGPATARGSLPGLGDETQEIDNVLTNEHETVHTFGWYMRKMIKETKDKDATPILLSLTVRNIWKDGKVERGSGKYALWTQDLAKAENVAFIDLTNIVADKYEEMGKEAVKPLFPRDHTHTGASGAEKNAQNVVGGVKALHEYAIINTLSAAGRAIDVAPAKYAMPAKHPSARGKPMEEMLRHLDLPAPADPSLPSLFLIGDSTVRNGRGDGINGQWGWGDPLAVYFDPAKVNLVNRAVGGTGARTFINIGYWDLVLSMLKPGDIVVIQFGTNDNGPTGPLRGTGEETEDRQTPGGKTETVHTYGWYLRKYIADAKAKGATPIVCTLVPRNIWEEGKIARAKDRHADWARAVAKDQNVPLLDLYEAIARRYDELGQEKVTQIFADQRVHTTRDGAELNAQCVLAEMRAIAGDPLAKFMRSKPAANW
jgi:lysophospholipase L1-like esterase